MSVGNRLHAGPWSQSLWQVFLAILATCWVAGAQPGWAAAPASEQQFQGHLVAGEFAPALALAEQAAPVDRDRWLKSIASAQAESGSTSASYYTLGQMTDDRQRAQSFKEIGSSPARGGGVQPDFNSLMDLLTSTVKPTSWSEVGGPGAVEKFAGGVYVDLEGVMRPAVNRDGAGQLSTLREEAITSGGNHDARQSSALRKVSLTRLERAVQMQLAMGKPLDEEMDLLAGLRRVQYVLIYPETGDLVLVGPAGDWQFDREGRQVNPETGRPVLRLDDLVVVMRHMLKGGNSTFGCSITPTQDGLAATQAFLNESAKKPLKPGQRPQWLDQVRKHLGRQTIEVFGIDPHTRAAQVMVEADYRMKLVGIGLEEGVLGVPSYLASVKVPAGQAPSPLDVLRWWFTLNYQALLASEGRDAFQLRGQGVKVLSENELLEATGQRVHTGKSNDLNQQFAHNFTEHFAELASKYPVYAELQNIFDLALVAALIKSEGLADRVDWHLTCFNDPEQFSVAAGQVPKSVETVINHRVIGGKHILAAVSGGVSVDAKQLVKRDQIDTDHQGSLGSQRAHSAPLAEHPRNVWWWD